MAVVQSLLETPFSYKRIEEKAMLKALPFNQKVLKNVVRQQEITDILMVVKVSQDICNPKGCCVLCLRSNLMAKGKRDCSSLV